MPAVELTSPNVKNYFIGKGVVAFKRDGEDDFRDMGNAATVEFTPELETLDHFSSRAGVKSKDRTVVTSKSGTVHLVLDEWTPSNLAIALLGDQATDVDGNIVIDIFSSNAVSGVLKFTGSNEIGPRYEVELARVDFIPSAALGLITDEWGQIDVTGNSVAVAGKFGTATLLANEGESVEPESEPVSEST